MLCVLCERVGGGVASELETNVCIRHNMYIKNNPVHRFDCFCKRLRVNVNMSRMSVC